jgi:hypothetical protein
MLTAQRAYHVPTRLSDFPFMSDKDVPGWYAHCGPSGGLYFIADVEEDLIKIGRSEYPHSRLCAIRSSLKKPHLRMMACFNFGMEQLAHRQFKYLRVKGEWFSSSPVLLEAILDALHGTMPWQFKPKIHDRIDIPRRNIPRKFPWDEHLPVT